MFCDNITKVVMGCGIGIFKGTGYLDKYLQSIIIYEVEKGFAKSSNRQGVVEILETF